MRANNLTGKSLAHKLGWAESRVSRLLLGRRGVHEADVAMILDICAVTAPERARLLRLCAEIGQARIARDHKVPWQQWAFHSFTQRANRIAEYACLTMPELLCTENYAREMFTRSAAVPADTLHGRVNALVVRAELLSSHAPPTCEFLIHEWVLRNQVGEPAVWVGQLDHLLRMAARPAVSLRVVSAAESLHAGPTGPFTILEFDTGRPVAYRPAGTSGVLLDRRPDVAICHRAWSILTNDAMGESESAKFIAKLTHT